MSEEKIVFKAKGNYDGRKVNSYILDEAAQFVRPKATEEPKTEVEYTTEQYKQRGINSAKKSLEHLLVVIEEPIITNTDDDVSSDKLKNCVQTKKIAIFDYFEIIMRIDAEQRDLGLDPDKKDSGHGFAEGKAK